ncbi:MAG: hypothetical protein WDZ58_05035 [Gemmatimonadaceae bacterium]
MTSPQSPIAGSVLPLKRAEDLISTLPGVISARIVAGDTGAVNEIHVLTTAEYPAKQTVRNIESALIAHLGMRVDHRKVSVAITSETGRPESSVSKVTETQEIPGRISAGRHIYFEDVEVRGSRAKGTTCRVTLRKGTDAFVGEAEGVESERSRVELAARATLLAISRAYGDKKLVFEGVKIIDIFERTIVVVGVTAHVGRDNRILTGTCEVRESAETASVLAVLDATNRWLEYNR